MTTYLGLPLRSPLIASAGPLSASVDGVRELADTGLGAVVLYSLFEEQVRRQAERDEWLEELHEFAGEAFLWLVLSHLALLLGLSVLRRRNQALPMLSFSIEANAFLRGMVRRIVGTLLLVGQGRMSAAAFGEILLSRDISRAAPPAPPQGLCLWRVRYNDEGAAGQP